MLTLVKMPYSWKSHVAAKMDLKWPQLCGGHLRLYACLHHERMSMSIQISEHRLYTNLGINEEVLLSLSMLI